MSDRSTLARGDLSKIGKMFNAEMDRLYPPVPPPILYHYTTIEAMQSIIRTGIMRAFNVEFMNDHAELRYAASVMRAHIDRAYAIGTDPFFCDVLNRIRRTTIPLDIRQLFLLS